MARPKGIPKTGGRKKGSVNKKTDEIAKSIAESGLTPLDYMILVMRDENNSLGDRLEAAKSAAPYVHRKMPQAITGEDGDPLRVSFEVIKK